MGNPMTHQPSPQDTGVPGDGLVPGAGRTGASSRTFQRLAYNECDIRTNGRGDCIEISDPKKWGRIATISRCAGCAGVTDEQRAYGRLFVASPDLFNACAPFAKFSDYPELPDDALVLHDPFTGDWLTAGQVRAIKAAMSKAGEGSG